MRTTHHEGTLQAAVYGCGNSDGNGRRGVAKLACDMTVRMSQVVTGADMHGS